MTEARSASRVILRTAVEREQKRVYRRTCSSWDQYSGAAHPGSGAPTFVDVQLKNLSLIANTPRCRRLSAHDFDRQQVDASACTPASPR